MPAEPPSDGPAAKPSGSKDAAARRFDDLRYDQRDGDDDRDRWLADNVPPHHR